MLHSVCVCYFTFFIFYKLIFIDILDVHTELFDKNDLGKLWKINKIIIVDVECRLNCNKIANNRAETFLDFHWYLHET